MAIILVIMTIAVILATLASYGHRDKTLNKLGVFFLFLFLPLWAFSLWVPAIGPVWNGIAIIDLLVFALFLTFVIFLISSGSHHLKKDEIAGMDGDSAVKRSYTAGILMFLAFMILAIIVGFFRAGI